MASMVEGRFLMAPTQATAQSSSQSSEKGLISKAFDKVKGLWEAHQAEKAKLQARKQVVIGELRTFIRDSSSKLIDVSDDDVYWEYAASKVTIPEEEEGMWADARNRIAWEFKPAERVKLVQAARQQVVF